MENPFKSQESYEATLYDIGQEIDIELSALATEDLDAWEEEQLEHVRQWIKEAYLTT